MPGMNKRRDQKGDRPARPKILHAGMTKRSIAKTYSSSPDHPPIMSKPCLEMCHEREEWASRATWHSTRLWKHAAQSE